MATTHDILRTVNGTASRAVDSHMIQSPVDFCLINLISMQCYSTNMDFLCKGSPDQSYDDEKQLFDGKELYLNQSILDNWDSYTVETEWVKVVHLPHLTEPFDTGYLHHAIEIAEKNDAKVCLDANPFTREKMKQVSSVEDYDVEYGIENNPENSKKFLLREIINQGDNIVFDSGHMHLAENEYLSWFEQIVSQFQDHLQLVHLADARAWEKTDNNRTFGDGNVPISDIIQILDMYEYDGSVTIETPRDRQQEDVQYAREQLKN